MTGAPVQVDAAVLERLAAGSLVLAAGAAESAFRVALDWARASVAAHGPVRLLAPDELSGLRLCVTVTLVGSSAALAEQLPTGAETVRAVRALERLLGARADAVVALNTAGENALLSVAAAADCGLPLVDGDGCGRVLPLLEQSTFTLAGVAAAPLALATPSGDVVVVESAGGRVEDLVRPLVPAAGGWAVAVCYAMPGDVLAGSVVPGTVGRAIRAGSARPGNLFAPWSPRRLCRGRITAVEHPVATEDDPYGYGPPEPDGPTGPGSAPSWPELPSRPTSVLIAETEGIGRHFRLEAHNEVLLALADGAPVAAAPDQILILSASADRRVLDVERAVPGVEVEVVVIAAAPAWQTPQGRRLARTGAVDTPGAQEEPW
ncbi:DUF917 domain-containing protein [Streptomyces sp. NPDC056921]|uniref:DUF917 domain-containing protein n=1 Tax=Streptomyces sp. NPDC056921 TaxID=3345966 RepID=UPI00363FFEDC